MNTQNNIIDLTDFQWPKGPCADTYTPEQRLKAAQIYVLTRSNEETAKQSEINKRTIETWNTKKEPWWIELQRRVMDSKQQEIEDKLTRIIDKILGKIEDKLDTDKVGSLRDLVYSLGTVYDKRSLIRGEATQIQAEQKVDTKTQLEALKNEFEEVVNR